MVMYNCIHSIVSSEFDYSKMNNNPSKIVPRSIRKKCFVPKCLSSTSHTPNKIFIYVPRDERRKTWCKAAGYPRIELPPTSYICEDHFNLEEDLDNYLEWKMTNCRKRLKEGVCPRFFICQVEPAKPIFVPCNEPGTSLVKEEEPYDPLGGEEGESAVQSGDLSPAFSFVACSGDSIGIKSEFVEVKQEFTDDFA